MRDLPTGPASGSGTRPGPHPASHPAGHPDVHAGATAAELIARYHRHLAPLVAARRDGPVVAAPWLVAHALAALTTAEAIVEDLRRERWPLVVDALCHGATVAEVGAAMAGLDAQEVRVGLTSWADQLRRRRVLTDAEHAAVVALVAPGRPG